MINGEDVEPAPSEVTPKTADLHQNATRAGSGVMVIDLIRSNLRSYQCRWDVMTVGQLVRFYEMWGERMFNELTCVDPVTGELRTGTYYRGDVTCKMMQTDSDGMPSRYKDVQINFIER